MEKTWKPATAGTLSIIAGAIQVMLGIVVAAVLGIVGIVVGMGWLGAIGVPFILLGAVAIAGGIYALRRKFWGLALAGSICSFVGPFPLGIPAVLFVVLSKDEFR